MDAFRRTDLLLPLAGVTLACAVSWWVPATPLDLLFGSAMLTALLAALRLAITASRRARVERRRMRRLTPTHSQELVRRAVSAERVRLSEDIESCVRDSMQLVAARAAAAGDATDPRELLRLIQAEAGRTHAELRRQLGLLADPDPDSGPPRAAAGESPSRAAGLGWTDVAVAVGVMGLALAEARLYPLTDPALATSAVGTALTLATAGTLVGRRRYPVIVGLACAVVVSVGGFTDQPVQDGLALMTVIGALSWTLSRSGRWTGWLTLVVLGLAVLVTRPPEQPVNAMINGLVLLVAAVGGALVGHQHQARLAAEHQARLREQDIERARSAALLADRHEVARELHDAVSHAVGVVAVQAGAGELCFERDPAQTRCSISIIRATAEQAVAELDRLRPEAPAASRRADDVVALVQRMRTAGMRVTLRMEGDPPATSMPTVFRVVQESLTNALRHAPGARVCVEIRVEEDHTDIRVVDDGPGAGVARPGFGLTGLRERVGASGGRLECRNQPDAGFELQVRLPSAAAGSA